jgi:hypothetical protein
MFNCTKLWAGLLGLAALTLVSTGALPTSAFAAKQGDLVNACKRMGKDCSLGADSPGYATGCTSKACFECFNGKCKRIP